MKDSRLPALASVANVPCLEPLPRFSSRINLLPIAAALCLASLPSDAHGQGALTNGNAHDGGIAAVGETDTWTITATEGERFTVQLAELTGGAGFTPRLELLSPDGATLGTDINGVVVRLDIQAPVSGTFSAVVSDANGNGTGTYRLRYAKVPGAFEVPVGDEGGALANGQDHDGVIALGDLDLWTLAASAGDRISLHVAETAGGAGFTPQIEVMSPDGTRLGFASGSVTARLDLQAREAGTYSVLVSDASQTGNGSYRLRLAQVPGSFVVPVGDQGGPLTDVVNNDGEIAVGDVDIWTFSATSGELVTLALAELTGGAGFTPRIELFGPAGVWKADGQGAAGATLTVAIEETGTYTVLVSDVTPAGTGTYRVTLNRSNLVVPAGEALVNGTSHLGEISPAGDLDTWTFFATAGESIVVRAGETATSAFVPWLRLYGPDGALLGNAFSTVAAEVATRATNSGVFRVTVADGSGGGQQTGGYRISLAKTGSEPVISPTDEGGPLVNGETYLATIGVGDIDAWTFTANAGETMVVRAGETTAASPLLPYLRLYGPNGALLDSYYSTVAAEVTFRATNSGTFLVVMGDGNNGVGGTGNYRISLAKTGSEPVISLTDEGGPLVNGTTYLATIDTGDIDAWTFTANAGETMVVRAGETTASSPLLPYLRLYGPNGALLDSYYSTVAAEVTFRATNSGTFLVVMGDGNNGVGGTGNYRISLAKTGSEPVISLTDEGGPLVNGTTYLATIDTGDIDAWTFTANAGETMVVRAGETTASSPLLPYLRLYGPNGALLDSYYSAAVAEVTFRATNSGTFLVVMGDGNNGVGGTGNYRISLAKTGSEPVISLTDEGGPLVNGTTYLATIDTGDIDAWTFTANAGETMVVRAGETTASSPLLPYLRLYGPNGALLDSYYSAAAAEVTFRATNSGTFLVVMGDGNNGVGGTGNYRISLAKTGSEPVISLTDEGGPLINGMTYLATIEAGDIDAWTITANAGESLVVRVGETTAGSPLSPWLRIFGPDGAQLDTYVSSAAAEVEIQAALSGTFLVVMGDGNNGVGGAGNYRISLALMPERFSISANDEGGPVPAGAGIPGEITTGDLDLWSFEANKGNSLVVRMVEQVGPGLTPWLRVYNAQGILVGQNVNTTAAQVAFVAAQSGLYTVLAGDGNNGLGGIGTYELTVTGLPEQGKQLRYERPAANSLLINWPAELTGYVLQQNPVLDTTGWEDVQLVPADNGFNVRLTVPIEPTGNRFFRLRLPAP